MNVDLRAQILSIKEGDILLVECKEILNEMQLRAVKNAVEKCVDGRCQVLVVCLPLMSVRKVEKTSTSS